MNFCNKFWGSSNYHSLPRNHPKGSRSRKRKASKHQPILTILL